MIRELAGAAVSTLALMLGHAAAAQEGAPDTRAQATDVTQPELEEVIVTARKRAESLQNVPASILAVGEEQIENLNAKSLLDLNGAAPNFRIGIDGTLTIRGISSNARNSGFEAGAAVYIDGVYQGRPIGNNQDLADVERVEVLRGPQGTLYGKNTTAGAISIVTVQPGKEWTGRAEAQYGERNDLRFAGYVAGPLVPDVLGIKIAGYRRTSDGYERNLFNGDRYGNMDVWGTRGELRLTAGALDLALRGDYIKDNGRPAMPEPVAGFAAVVAPGRDTVNFNSPYNAQRRGGGASLTGDADLGGGYTLTSITAWRTFRAVSVADDDFSPRNLVYHRFNDRPDQVTQEVRLASPGADRFNWILGAFYLNQKLTSYRPITLASAFPVQGQVVDDVRVRTDAYAVFGNADLRLFEPLTLNVGLRYTNERKKLNFVQLGVPAIGYPNLTLNDRMADDDLSPTASLSYRVSPAVTTYVKFSRGFKSGGWNPDITATARIGFGAENVNSYEAGIRTRLAGGLVGINLTGYYMDYDNLQVSQFLGTFVGYIITNAGKARVKGLEGEIFARPTDWLTFNVSAAYNDARYRDFDSGTGRNFAGQQFTNSPKFSLFASSDIDTPISSSFTFQAHGDVRYQSKVYFDDLRSATPGLGAFAQDGYALVNLRVGVVHASGVEFSLFADNVADNRVLLNRTRDALNLGLTLDAYVPPRQFGGRLVFRF